jgi:hypothetical protein
VVRNTINKGDLHYRIIEPSILISIYFDIGLGYSGSFDMVITTAKTIWQWVYIREL